jgi:hypothetical protein
VGGLSCALAAATTVSATASPPLSSPWASSSSATIHPGVMTTSAEGGKCVANFVFREASAVYLGQAASCMLAPQGPSSQHGWDACGGAFDWPGDLALGSAVKIDGARQLATLVYSSWLAMEDAHDLPPALGQQTDWLCSENDFALVRLDPADVAHTNPSMPVWGGPTGLSTTGLDIGAQVVSTGTVERRAVRGVYTGRSDDGWLYEVHAYLPVEGWWAVGSGFLDASGRAVGVYTWDVDSFCVVPAPGAANEVGDLSRELSYLGSHSPLRVTLVPGTRPFHMLGRT